jgi:tRNA-dihydrouridine synthase A
MDWTDVHYRQMARMMSNKVWLWTEMVVDKTIIHSNNLDMHLWFPPEQHPIVLQVGGSDPETLRAAAAKIVPYGYDEVNLNCGCPSDRVAGAGCFGASMMLQPQLVASCMQVCIPSLVTDDVWRVMCVVRDVCPGSYRTLISTCSSQRPAPVRSLHVNPNVDCRGGMLVITPGSARC